jgi:hypothetical protein
MSEPSAAEAFRAFARWRAEHDPDDSMEIDEAAIAYFMWSSTNSIAPYLDVHANHGAGR